MADVSFGEWLKRKRKAGGFTQEQLAKLVNCSKSTLRKIESEERRPSIQLLDLFVDIFNIPASQRNSFLNFARGDLQINTDQFMGEAPLRSASTLRLRIPSSVTSLIGREREVEEICDYIQRKDVRLVTLIGPPGIGKTRLSLELARKVSDRFPDGVFFVELAPFDDPSLVPSVIVQTLGYVDVKGQTTFEQLVDGIADRQMLLVLDNFEHLMDGAAPLVSSLLSACSQLKILVTSRESLRVAGEWLYPVQPLRVPKEDMIIDLGKVGEFSALKLFTDRARAVRPDFSLHMDNIAAVASICARLDGLPLAIELIATRVRIMSPQLLLERLNDQFVLSANGMRPESERQKTLNNAIGWSYNSLPEEEQDLFARLSVFSGGFFVDAIESIFSKDFADRTVPELITSLLDKSLLQRTSDTHEGMRLNMLVTIRQFALEQLRKSGLEQSIRDGHLAYFLELAEQADKEIHGAMQLEWGDRLEIEHDNFHAALEWCVADQKTETALRLLGALCWPWDVRNHYNEIHTWFQKVRALPRVTDYPAHYATLLGHIAQHKWMMGDFRDAQLLLEESRSIWQGMMGEAGELGLANTLDWLGMVARWSKGDGEIAHQYFTKSFELYEKHSNPWGMAITMFHLAIIEDGFGHSDLARSLFEQSLSRMENFGDLWGIARVSQLLGQLFLKQGNYEKAHHFFKRHLEIDETLQFREGVVVALRNLGNFHRYQGEYELAKLYFDRSLDLCQEYNLKDDKSKVLYFIGILALQQNDYPQALKNFRSFYELAQSVYEKVGVGDLLFGLAAIAAGANQPERAARVFGAAQNTFEAADNRFFPFDRIEFERHIQIAHDQLGSKNFTVLAEEGRLMMFDQALFYAFDVRII